MNIAHLISAAEMNTAGVPLPKSASPPGDGTTEKELKVSLEDRELWGKFQAATNEMIVTKTGRYRQYNFSRN